MLTKEQAIERFPKLDAKAAKAIPDLRQNPEIVAAREKLQDLEQQLAAIKREIAEAESRPEVTRTGTDLDAQRILQGRPLETQAPAGVLDDLRRKRVAIERALQLQAAEIHAITKRVAEEACNQLEPLARKYATAVLDAIDRLAESLESLNSFGSFLSSRGLKLNMRPGHWQPLPLEVNILNSATQAAAVRRQALGLPAKK
jgi:hypothetical protein